MPDASKHTVLLLTFHNNKTFEFLFLITDSIYAIYEFLDTPIYLYTYIRVFIPPFTYAPALKFLTWAKSPL